MRLDNYLVENNYFDSRTKAKQAIDRGEVFVNGKLAKKASYDVNDGNSAIEIVREDNFVSLGGYKLKKALCDFAFDVSGLTIADVGASTGGFTDCLLQFGAKKVYAVDLNDGLLHEKLRNDSRVISVIKNARDLTCEDFGEELDLIVADLSFISATYVLGIFSSLLSKGKHLILLIKPQFEVGERIKLKNGIIHDEEVHKKVCGNVLSCAVENGFKQLNFTNAPISEKKNKEFLVLLEKV